MTQPVMSNPIDFYFDFSSPYGYFAAMKIERWLSTGPF